MATDATERVTLRQWRDTDLEPYAAMNRDPEVMRYFPGFRTHDETRESLERQRTLIAQCGWGLWAIEVDGEFAGFTGLAVPAFDAPFMPCVEIGWRLQRRYWVAASLTAPPAMRWPMASTH